MHGPVPGSVRAVRDSGPVRWARDPGLLPQTLRRVPTARYSQLTVLEPGSICVLGVGTGFPPIRVEPGFLCLNRRGLFICTWRTLIIFARANTTELLVCRVFDCIIGVFCILTRPNPFLS